MSRKAEFRINKDGNLQVVKLEGFGSGCMKFTEGLERGVGQADESTRKMTDEYDKPVKQGTDDYQQIGS